MLISKNNLNMSLLEQCEGLKIPVSGNISEKQGKSDLSERSLRGVGKMVVFTDNPLSLTNVLQRERISFPPPLFLLLNNFFQTSNACK